MSQPVGDMAFARMVGQILHRVDLAEGHEGHGDLSSTAAAPPRAASTTTAPMTRSSSPSYTNQQLYGPLTFPELAELSLLCTAAASTSGGTSSRRRRSSTASRKKATDDVDYDDEEQQGFAAVEGDQLVGLMELLNRHVNLASTIHLIEAASQQIASSVSASQATHVLERWMAQGDGKDMLFTLRGGLEAAAIILFIVNSPNIDRRVVREDAIDASITLLRLHLSKHLIPALNNAGYFINGGGSTISPSKRRSSSNMPGGVGSPVQPPAQKKRRRSSGGQDTATTTTASSSNSASSSCLVSAKDLRGVYKHIASTMTLQLVLMDRLEKLVQTLPLSDQQVLLIMSGSLSAFEIDSAAALTTFGGATTGGSLQLAQQLQIATIGIVTAAFRIYTPQRAVILEDLFPILLKLPTGKRSLRTHPVRYASGGNSLQEFNTKHVASLIGNGGSVQQSHSIQMITALVLSLVQASVQRPSLEMSKSAEDGGKNKDENKREEQSSRDGTLRSGLQQCHVTADTFVGLMLKQCRNSGKTGGVCEYRMIFANLVEDLLLVLMIPECPAAELILSTIQRQINYDMTIGSSLLGGGGNTTKQTQLDVTYLNYIFDIMGKICSVQARLLSVARDLPIRMTLGTIQDNDVPMSSSCCSSTDQQHQQQRQRAVACFCQSKHTNVILIECEACHTVMHGPCVGVANPETAPDEWFCDACRLGQLAHREKRRVPDSAATYIDLQYTMHQYYYYLTTTHGARGGLDQIDAMQYHIAHWVDELDRSSKQKKTVKTTPVLPLITRMLENYWDQRQHTSGSATESLLTEDGALRVLVNLLTQTSALFLSFKKQLSFLLRIMSDESAHARRRLSLKVIEKCVEGDQTLMLLPIVTNSVSKRLADESISVREAAVSLVGNYVDRSPMAIQSYQAALIPCLTDPGVSVRKRAVRIFESILVKNPHFKGSSTVCNILLQRSADPKEEDGVRDLIDDVFCHLWLRDGDRPVENHHQSKNEDAVLRIESIPGVVTPNSPVVVDKSRFIQKRSDMAAEQMMEVVRAAGTGVNVEALLKKLLNGGINSDSERKQAERQKRQSLGLTQCSQLVDSLFALLIIIEEQRSIRPHVGKDLSATLTTIAVFASVSPSYIVKHLDTMIPFLKADNGVSIDDEATIVFATCDILYRIASSLDRRVIGSLVQSGVPNDLIKISYRFGPATIASAIRAFSALASTQSNLGGGVNAFSDKLLDVAKTFYGFAVKKDSIDDFSTVAESVKTNVHRALTVLGLICENCSTPVDTSTWEDEMDINDAPPLVPKELTWDALTLACYRLFSRYLQKKDLATKCKALAALKGIFVAQPQLLLMMDHVGLFDEVMSDEAGEPLQLEALECWRNILEAEEIRIDSGKAEASMDEDGNVTLSKRISGDQNGDATLFGGVLTNHAERLFEMTRSPSQKLRLSSLQLVGLLLRQGLVNPNEAVPYLFALQGDVDSDPIRSLALTLLMAEGEKRPDTLRQRIGSGVKQAYLFQRAVYPNKANVSAVVVLKTGTLDEVHSIFGRLFEECITKNRKQRLGLYKSLLTLFDNDDLDGDDLDSSAASGSTSVTDLSLLSFVAQILAHLPYSTTGDPLFIAHHVAKTFTIRGLQIMDRFADLLRPFGLSSSDEFDESNSAADALELAAKSKFPSRTPHARALSMKEFPMTNFVALIREGTALAVLLRLKTFLCTHYNLSAERYLAYNPDTKERLCEKGIAKVKFSEPFDASVAGAIQSSSSPDDGRRRGSIDKDALLRQYADIRRRFREESASEVAVVVAATAAADGQDDPTTGVEEAQAIPLGKPIAASEVLSS